MVVITNKSMHLSSKAENTGFFQVNLQHIHKLCCIDTSEKRCLRIYIGVGHLHRHL